MSLSQRLHNNLNIEIMGIMKGKGNEAAIDETDSRYSSIKDKIHKEVIDRLELEWKKNEISDETLAVKTRQMVVALLEKEAIFLPYSERLAIAEEIIDEVLGLGPIEKLVNDDEVSEIMVNGPKHIYVERHGLLYHTDVVFRNDEHVMHIIDKIVAPLGRRIDESQPYVDARLPDGSRVNAIIPPLALKGPTVTIRKFARNAYDINDLMRFGTLNPAMARFLDAAIKGKLNAIISGGTGTGKTTLLNVLVSFIPDNERIITIEDAAELKLGQEHVISLESRQANIEGKGAVTIRDLVRNSLRMRPDRIIVGEVRGGEALDMLQAMNTGHDGSLTTGHSNSPRDMLARVETMVLMAGFELPMKAIRQQIASAIDLIVHVDRLRDGTRVITHISEVLGMEGDIVQMQDIFLFEQITVNDVGKVIGEHYATGIKPHCLDKISAEGIKLPKDLFRPRMT